jgi:Ankyrin repeats (3 copies)
MQTRSWSIRGRRTESVERVVAVCLLVSSPHSPSVSGGLSFFVLLSRSSSLLFFFLLFSFFSLLFSCFLFRLLGPSCCSGVLALTAAVVTNSVESVALLLRHMKCEVNFVDAKGCTLLHYAALAGKEEVVRFLLHCGADSTVEDSQGRTAQTILAGSDLAALLVGTSAQSKAERRSRIHDRIRERKLAGHTERSEPGDLASVSMSAGGSGAVVGGAGGMRHLTRERSAPRLRRPPSQWPLASLPVRDLELRTTGEATPAQTAHPMEEAQPHVDSEVPVIHPPARAPRGGPPLGFAFNPLTALKGLKKSAARAEPSTAEPALMSELEKRLAARRSEPQ